MALELPGVPPSSTGSPLGPPVDSLGYTSGYPWRTPWEPHGDPQRGPWGSPGGGRLGGILSEDKCMHAGGPLGCPPVCPRGSRDFILQTYRPMGFPDTPDSNPGPKTI